MKNYDHITVEYIGENGWTVRREVTNDELDMIKISGWGNVTSAVYRLSELSKDHNDNWHRTDGPAYESAHGYSYYIFDKYYHTKEEWEKAKKSALKLEAEEKADNLENSESITIKED